jgi:hypothetical protein
MRILWRIPGQSHADNRALNSTFGRFYDHSGSFEAKNGSIPTRRDRYAHCTRPNSNESYTCLTLFWYAKNTRLISIAYGPVRTLYLSNFNEVIRA